MDKSIDNSNPCYKCENRKLYCHSSCERYLKWKSENVKFSVKDEWVDYCKKNYRKRKR